MLRHACLAAVLAVSLPAAAAAQFSSPFGLDQLTQGPNTGDAPAGPMIDARNAQAILAVLQGLGYRALLNADSDGDPRIDSASQGVNWSMYFYGCTNGVDCQSVQYSAGFNLRNGIAMQTINTWNRTKRYGKSWIDDENDPYLEMDINLDGGVTEANFRDSLDIWNEILADYLVHIDW